MKKNNFKIPWSLRSHKYTQNEINKVIKFLKSDEPLVNGLELKKFEKNFQRYLSTRGEVFAVSCGSSAIELAAATLSLRKGDEIIVPAHTYVASALPFCRYNCNIVWADIKLDTMTINPDDILKRINKKTKAIIITHLYGMPCDINKIKKICRLKKIILIEDCAQALGAEYFKKKVGTFGDMSIFSFHAQKNMSTIGAGGALVINNKKYHKLADGLRKNGHRAYSNKSHYWLPAMVDVYEDVKGITPFNFPFTELQSIIGNNLLKRIQKLNNDRIRRAKKIISSLKSFKYLKFQKYKKNYKNVFHLLPALIDSNFVKFNRDDFIKIMSKKYKIQVIIQYLPMYRYHFFKQRDFNLKKLEATDFFYDNMISLPFHHWMSDLDLEYLIKSIKKTLIFLEKKTGYEK
ncbi:DegT/DnrJ/EryC1/StrS family aminotransferase [Candidatus Pelagibacter sp.]|jgi:perosamine synthetase|nr:DegT/DnrJ/EryC1/StrS family aminotransferase [Candidatus Pelagibacter sp.]